MGKNSIYASFETNANQVRILKGKQDGQGNGKFRRGNRQHVVVALDSDLAKTYKGKPIFRLKDGSASCLPWLGGEEKTIVTAERYDETAGNNYVQQVMSRLSPQTLDSVRNWIMFAAVIGIIIFQFWLYNETQKDLKQMQLTLQQILAQTSDKPVFQG